MVFMRRAYFFLYIFSFLFNSSIGYVYWYINLKDDYVVNSDRREYYAEIVRASGQNNSRSFTIAPSSSSSTTFKADDLSFKIRKSVIDSSLEQYSDILATVKANANLLVNDSLDLIVDDFSDSRTVGRIDFDNRGYVKVKRLNIADNNIQKIILVLYLTIILYWMQRSCRILSLVLFGINMVEQQKLQL